ncbi:MAG TPA: holo-ACP synthase [Halothiobacillaceae bacterium]|nr:holo-ACP synthase [Halothiobacillaceae bacterium]
MIRGIGTDIVAIKRIEQALDRHGERFAKRILTTEELKNMPQARPASWLAKRFASKEAVVKALGTGFRDGLGFHDIQTSHDALGRPVVRLIGRAEAQLAALGARRLDLSVSDEAHYAVAFVVIS